MILLFEPKWNARSTRVLFRGETQFGKIFFFFTASGSKAGDAVFGTEDAFSLHTVEHHSGYKSAGCEPGLFKTKFPDCEIARKF